MLNANNPDNEMVKRIAVLTREIGMLQQAQSRLSGIPARQNRVRIGDRQEELATLNAHAELLARVGADELARCEALSC